MDKPTTVEWLSKAIEQATRSTKFCVSGCLPVVDPGMEVEGLGTITLPLKPKTAKELVASCQLAPYGKGNQTLVDKNVRNTFELDPKKFCLSDAWNGQSPMQRVRLRNSLDCRRNDWKPGCTSCWCMRRAGSSCRIATARSTTGWWRVWSSCFPIDSKAGRWSFGTAPRSRR